MLRNLLPGIIFLGVSACASTSNAPTATHSADSTSAETINSEPHAAGIAEAENVAASGEAAEVITVAEVPQVVAADAVAPSRPKKVCQRVKPTGSHRYRRVCYTQSELAQSTDDARQVFGELHRQQQVPNGK